MRTRQAHEQADQHGPFSVSGPSYPATYSCISVFRARIYASEPFPFTKYSFFFFFQCFLFLSFTHGVGGERCGGWRFFSGQGEPVIRLIISACCMRF